MTEPIIKYWLNGNKFYEQYVVNGKLHRDPEIGPARINYYEDGNKCYERYVVNGKFHRDPEIGPADIWYYKNGNKELERYIVNNKFHRDPAIGPARIQYDEHENINIESYFVNGNSHNPYRPAYNDYNLDFFTWCFNGIEYTKKVNEYLDKHNLKWQSMDHTDFDIMWTILL